MSKNDSFSEIYDGMNALYSKVEDMMGSAYIKVKNNPSDDDSEKLLNDLNDIAQSILYMQMSIVKDSKDSKEIRAIMATIKDRVDALEKIKHVNKKSR